MAGEVAPSVGSLTLQAGSPGLQPQHGVNGHGGHTCNPTTSGCRFKNSGERTGPSQNFAI